MPVENAPRPGKTESSQRILGSLQHHHQELRTRYLGESLRSGFSSGGNDVSIPASYVDALTPLQYSRLRLARMESQFSRRLLDSRFQDLSARGNVSQSISAAFAETTPPATSFVRRVSPPSGLDLLGAVSISNFRNSLGEESRELESSLRSTTSLARSGTSDMSEEQRSVGGKYYTEVRACDVLCGRGGRSNHHPGNKLYRKAVKDMRDSYRNAEDKRVKANISRVIVDRVYAYGGRFLKKDEEDNYYILSKSDAQKKTSQALRETKELK